MGAPPAVDCDVHDEVPGIRTLFPYLSPHWVETIEKTVFDGPTDCYYPKLALRADAEEGPPPDLEAVRREVLEARAADRAILNCTYAIDGLHNPDQAVALAQAVNDWQIAEWLEKDERLRASIVVPIQVPSLAIAEIERVAEHPGFVQVLLPVRSQHPYGSRLYHPLWETIARHGLVAGIHFGGAPGNPPTPSGWSSYYFEEHVTAALNFASQVTSIVVEGVFDLCPTLRVSLLEGGFTWMPMHMWRFDKEWKNLRRLVPWVRRPPSDYIRDHIRMTVQPLDAPGDPAQLVQVVEQLESDRLLLYASDYPHRHTADVSRDLLAHLSPSLAARILAENAREWYNL